MPNTRGRRRSHSANELEIDETFQLENSKLRKMYKILVNEVKRLIGKTEQAEDAKHKKIYFDATMESLGKLEDAFLGLPESDVEEKVEEFSEIKDKCLGLKIDVCGDLIGDARTSEGNPTHVGHTARGSTLLKLPKIGLVDFQGETHKWLSFRDIFTNSIIKNDNLNDLQRLTYLQSCVKNDAARIIRGFEITEENFKHAWQSLVNRYENVKELTFAHLRKIFELRSMKTANSKNLLEMVDVLNESLRNLDTLGMHNDKFSEAIFLFHLQSKLDPDTLKHWELQSESNKIPSLKDFLEFLEKQARGITASNSVVSKTEVKYSKPSLVSNSANIQTVSTQKCPLCNNAHPLFKCQQYNNLSLKDRWGIIRNKKLCSNCLGIKHFAKQCGSQGRCRACHRNHHTSLHSYTSTLANPGGGTTKSVNGPTGQCNILPPGESTTPPCLSINATIACNTLLSTAKLKVKNGNGQYVWCRALIDNGSQKTLVTKAFLEKLGLPTQNSIHTIFGINNTKAETSLEEVRLQISPHFNNETFTVQALVVKNVTSNLPNFTVKVAEWPHLSNLRLADPEFHVPAPIEMILGADLFFNLIIGHPIVGPKGTPTALDTKLGFILSGSLFTNHKQPQYLSCHSTIELHQQLAKFWELEAVPQISPLSVYDNLCEEFYKRSVRRDEMGRYEVSLPFKPDITLGDTYYLALKRLHALEYKLNKHPEIKESYHKFMQEYVTLNHMEIVPDNSEPTQSFYLPHHCVFNFNSTTTKIRVVFDGSMKSTSGNSLNDALLTGPKLQNHIFTLLLQFRSFPVALNADIKKMYRQIKISRNDVDMQRILWRSDPSDPVSQFRLLTVSYGLSCSPFLALRTLQQLAFDEGGQFPQASYATLHHFYIDDLLSGAQSIGEAHALVSQLNALMKKGGFTLCKWRTNCPEVLIDMPDELKANSSPLEISEDQSPTILGIKWDHTADIFQINVIPSQNVTSKRSLLSFISKTFDPLGILSPTTITLKIMLQQLWRDKHTWDESLPPDLTCQWEKFCSSLDALKSIHIPRHFNLSPSSKIQLLGFSDASTRAYAAVFYLRVIDHEENITVTFLAAKTRVAPVKTLTLPKLELCAMLLLSNLLQSVTLSLALKITDIFLWSDSQIALSWISSDPGKQDVFVAHRVAKIQCLTQNATWIHILSADNPADCASRGILPNQLLTHPLWWTGPEWLMSSSFSSHITPFANYTTVPQTLTTLINLEASNVNTVTTSTLSCHGYTSSSISDLILKLSSYSKLLRTTAWLLRFIHNSRFPKDKHYHHLTASEIREALICLVKTIQADHFATEIAHLQQCKPLPCKSKLLSLNVFLDEQSVLRVGGRLSNRSDLTFDQRHQMLLPAKHHFTMLLINSLHLIHLHAGTQLVLSFLRQQFWLINARNVIRQILHKCIICFKLKAQPCSQLMGNLPSERITLVRPFSTVGVDFSGAFLTKPNIPRSKIKIKSYVCLFICLSTKAIHLELVSELSTICFLACLRRFVSRRGLPTDIFSDNAANFRGAASYLNQFHALCKSSDIQDFCSAQCIQWHFIPAYSPNFGGLWEASIKLTKTHLVRSCKSCLLNFEQLSTLLCQIEAIINSRPIMPMSSDPKDYQVLTPGHFLIGQPLTDLSTGSFPSSSSSMLTRWRLIQDIRLHFWKRWSLEYLHYLQPRSKWTVEKPNLRVGQLVLVQESNLPPLMWMTGRIHKLFQGADGKVRVVSLKTKKGDITRSISKLVPFPGDLLSSDPASSPAPRPEDVGSRPLTFPVSPL